MGVRGLTTFIAKNQENYFKKHQLRDSYVVIDAHSLCAQLYKFHTKSNDSFGGDYDKYARCIEHFFSMLKQCNVTAIVVFDGGYEKKKLRTVYMRLKSKIKAIRNANPVSLRGETVFPLFYREIFRDIVLQMGIATARCDFEADFEIACMARQLNCPVISYDSDFYIFDVLYIPFPTMDFHTTKIKDDKGTNYYIGCKLYKIETFLKQFGGLEKSHIPLMATILGNDYISKGVFRTFYSQLKTTRKKIGERGDQQRQITAVIKWLKKETYESAIRKILGRVKQNRRYRVAREIRRVAEGYICTESEILEFLNLTSKDKREVTSQPEIDVETIETDSENEDAEESGSGSDSDSDKLSEGEEKMDLTVEEVNSDEIVLPDWFQTKYRKSEFPTLFMDLLSLHNCFYMAQVEDTRNINTIGISLPMLRAIAKILISTRTTYFTYWARNDYGRVKKHHIDVSDLDLPVLGEIGDLNLEKRREILMLVLGMTKDDIVVVSQLPSNWHMYFYCLIFWARNAIEPTVTLCHVYAIILCLININIVDKQVGYYRLPLLFSNKYGSKLKTILEEKKKCTDEKKEVFCVDTNKITKDDCIVFVNSFVSNFAMDDKMESNFRLFNIKTVDAFAQFQSCIYFTKHLNALLLYPIEDMNISSFFNGTFLYNMHTNLESRNDIDVYVDLLLKNSGSIYTVFKSTLSVVKSLLDLKTSETTRKRRKRRRKKAEKNNDSEEIEYNEERSNESDFDANNKFSILRLVD